MKKRWGYVSSFGALWGAIEITLGSFLHSLRLPFTGTFLASMSAGLLVAQRQFTSFRGISIYTGIVAALIKSLSPDGIVIGPMVGILSEAIIVELILLIYPRSVITAVLAGVFCATWATLQGLLHQWLIYGSSIIELYLELIKESQKVLSISNITGIYLIVLFFSIIFLVSSSVTLFGFFIAKECKKVLIEQGLLKNN